MIRFSSHPYPAILDQCYRPLCFASEGSEYWGMKMHEIIGETRSAAVSRQLGIQGTCTLLKYRDRHFAVFTRHQIAQIAGETLELFEIRMDGLHVLMDDGRDGYNLPFNALLFSFDHQDDADEDDFVVVVIESQMLRPFMLECFFPIVRHSVGNIGDRALASGYPMHLQELLMHTDGNRTRKAAKIGFLTQRSSGSQGVFEYENDGESVDGMSGGPVYVVRPSTDAIGGEQFEVFIDGIIQRGGNGYLRYLTIERILDKIDERVFSAE